jgi:hypothetical protein
MKRGIQSPDYRVLYYSNPEAALKVPVTLSGGFGVVPAGTILAMNTSTSVVRHGFFVPYDPTAITGNEFAPGRAYLISNTASGEANLYTSVDDSYKFEVGDDVVVIDDTTAAQNLGAITAISRSSNRATITVTTAPTAAFTTARFAYLATKGYRTPIGILEKAVDTGTGSNAWRANTTMILGNCVLYQATLENMDSAAKSALSITVLGQYAYIK